MGEKRKRQPKPTKVRPPTRGQREKAEIDELTARLAEGAPPVGSNPLKMKAVPPGYAGVHKFEDLPLSDLTRRGLKDSKFKDLTAIQRAALPHSLCGRDILGAAKTGSGKTLSFLVPVRVARQHTARRQAAHTARCAVVPFRSDKPSKLPKIRLRPISASMLIFRDSGRVAVLGRVVRLHVTLAERLLLGVTACCIGSA